MAAGKQRCTKTNATWVRGATLSCCQRVLPLLTIKSDAFAEAACGGGRVVVRRRKWRKVLHMLQLPARDGQQWPPSLSPPWIGQLVNAQGPAPDSRAHGIEVLAEVGGAIKVLQGAGEQDRQATFPGRWLGRRWEA